MRIGHLVMISSQLPGGLIRRKTISPSSASYCDRNVSPGAAGARDVLTVRRRFESMVTVMVGLSHKRSKTSSRHSIALWKFAEKIWTTMPHGFIISFLWLANWHSIFRNPARESNGSARMR
jgi:hypothetical protein